VARKTGLTTEEAARESIQVLCPIAEKVERKGEEGKGGHPTIVFKCPAGVI